ncbi:hypothetical protein AVEN_231524-1 [Araneus ventricosus]|uniref:Ig-like domain-containing protein n=1 Tax=Araneus ventricosus TaxID=182803 RepID=A0A4Y2IC34_ARAVE|nr:hypothetical protein AVEN_231524-1 [Araneus ventricosus]
MAREGRRQRAEKTVLPGNVTDDFLSLGDFLERGSFSFRCVRGLEVRPLDVRIISPPHHLSAGRKVTLECESTGSRPRAVMTWWKGSQKIQTGNEVISDNGNLTLSTLSFVPNAEDHGKKFTCTAKNPSLPDSLIEDTRTITVHCK